MQKCTLHARRSAEKIHLNQYNSITVALLGDAKTTYEVDIASQQTTFHILIHERRHCHIIAYNITIICTQDGVSHNCHL